MAFFFLYDTLVCNIIKVIKNRMILVFGENICYENTKNLVIFCMSLFSDIVHKTYVYYFYFQDYRQCCSGTAGKIQMS